MDKYDALLKKQIGTSVFAIVFILILATVLFVLYKKHAFDALGKIGKTVVTIFIVAVILCATLHFSIRIYSLHTDLKEQSYITYVGDFEISSFKEGYVTLPNGNDSLTLNGKVDLPAGKHSGKIVCAKRSKYVVDWSVD